MNYKKEIHEICINDELIKALKLNKENWKELSKGWGEEK